ncbi:MAG: hypothetical protein J7M40_04780 [Planctomycetes bacterium]|nr:hypothetical protein [Planctomycetota bacterium]
MKRKTVHPSRLPRLFVAAVIVLSSATALWPEAPKLTFQQKEHFLRTAKVLRVRTLGEGITQSKRATLSDGKLTHDAQIQTIDEYKNVFQSATGVELNFQDSYKFNIAAYRLSRILGLDMIPPSVERRYRGTSGAFTWWLDDVLMTEKARYLKKIDPPDPDRWNRQIYIVRVFDQLIYNMDRNLGNLIITKGWNLKMIDHTRSFRLHKTLKNKKDLVRCDRQLLVALKKLNQETLMKQLRPYLTKGQIKALLARRDRIVELFEAKIAKHGEATVLYDFLKPQAPGS